MNTRIALLAVPFAGCLLIASCATVRPSVFDKKTNFAEPTGEDMHAFRAPASGPHVDKTGYLYDAGDKSCGGFPRLQVETAAGTCLGLVMPAERAIDPVAKRAFAMPRTLVQIPGTKDFLVADMGSWHMDRGALFRMSLVNGKYELKLLKDKLDYPHAVKLGPDGKFWIGELNTISRFSVNANGIVGWETMVAGLPAYAETDAHPLSQFTFDPRNGDLYVNSGAPSDHCFTKTPSSECPEIKGKDFSSILRVKAGDLAKPPAKSWTRVARGLRNSMAMAISPTGVLVQGENSRDFGDSSEPYEEMNVVQLGGPAFQYGWPYCYNFRATSPEWETNAVVNCAAALTPSREGDYQEPWSLLPPHVAPLQADYYQGAMFPELNGKLLMAWHGYRKPGHRLVAYTVDSSGRPVIDQKSAFSSFNFDRKEDGCTLPNKVEPRGGFIRHAPYSELISRWNKRKDIRPLGAPTSFTVADDGSIWIAEDKNQTIVRLARDGAAGFVKEKCDPEADDRMELLAWRRAILESPQLMSDYKELQDKLVVKYCAGCHDQGVDRSLTTDSLSGLDFLVNAAWFVPGKPQKSRALQAMLHEGTVPAMPLPDAPQFYGTPEGEDLVKLVQRWVGEIPADVETRYAKTSLKSARKIRSAPGGTLCGSLAAGATTYIDPRPQTFEKKDGWTWARLYLPPDHKALKGSACSWPQDGVFYVATTQIQ